MLKYYSSMDLCAVMVLQSDTEGAMFNNSQWESWNRGEKKIQYAGEYLVFHL